MYNELYMAWRREVGEAPLAGLPRDFYVKIADYLKRIREENSLPDKKSVKVSLLDHEAKNVQLMLEELLWARYRKLLKTISQNQTLPSDLLTAEEAEDVRELCSLRKGIPKVYAGPFTRRNQPRTIQTAQTTAQAIAQTEAKAEVETSHKRVTVEVYKGYSSDYGCRHEVLWSVSS